MKSKSQKFHGITFGHIVWVIVFAASISDICRLKKKTRRCRCALSLSCIVLHFIIIIDISGASQRKERERAKKKSYILKLMTIIFLDSVRFFFLLIYLLFGEHSTIYAWICKYCNVWQETQTVAWHCRYV